MTSVLDDERQSTLKEFKKRIKDYNASNLSDEDVVKWLVVKNFDVDQAEKALRDSLEWRRLHRVDEIFDSYQPPEVLRKYYSLSQTGVDKFGCPVWVSAQGKLDLRGILQCVTKKEYMRYMTFIMEEMTRSIREESKKSGKTITCQTMVFDMEGLSMRQLAHKQSLECGKETVKMFEDNYPENLRRVFVINAPKLFTLLFNIIKPFMHQGTISKVRIFGLNQNEWAPALLEEIDTDQLPGYYGGTLTSPDGDPKCPHILNLAGEVPHEYYMSKTPPQAKDYMETTNIIAGASGWKKLKFKVQEANSILRWEFISEGGDIGYMIYYKHPKDGTIELAPLERVESNIVAEEGQIVCERTGEYVFKFDNTYSYFRPKKLRYYVAVESPNQDKQKG